VEAGVEVGFRRASDWNTRASVKISPPTTT
jgi:hypothetical protein